MTAPADWTKRGITFFGGSRDGEDLDMVPARASISLSNTLGGEEFTETYERTAQTRDGRIVFRYVERKPNTHA